jgi:hypothetical protein
MSPKLWHLALTVFAYRRHLITPSDCYTANTEASGTRTKYGPVCPGADPNEMNTPFASTTRTFLWL